MGQRPRIGHDRAKAMASTGPANQPRLSNRNAFGQQPPSHGPNLKLELSLLERHQTIAGLDEVGRGALAGPICVGLVCLTKKAAQKSPPPGLNDSKLLTAAQRSVLVPAIDTWASRWTLGWASPREIDGGGMTKALRQAAWRAIAALPAPPDQVILDGSHDWLSAGPDLFELEAAPYYGPVTTKVKADQACASVAAASVVAKVARDQLMSELDATYPLYGWAANKGYGSQGHRQALVQHGPSILHRLSWALPAPAADET
ncbi:MAG: ribonuclease HII [Micrococcales bacterium]|nr:ribonuclease HII [Micrococcales bacterium]